MPLGLVEHKLDRLIIDRLALPMRDLEMDDWRDLMQRIRNPEHDVTIAVVGKYIDHYDAYKSIYEALDHAGFDHRARVLFKRIEAEEIERKSPEALLKGVDGILVPGGFGKRGVEGKVQAIQFARECEIPFFGICLGMQCAVIEFARNVLGLKQANSSEFATDTPDPVICLLEDQQHVTDKGGTMRLGTQPCQLRTDSRTAGCYGELLISERHRHRYEFNPAYLQQFEEHGMIAAGTSPEGKLVEVVEVPDHPWFVAVQYHPEFKSKPLKSQPLFHGFVEAALTRHLSRSHQTV